MYILCVQPGLSFLCGRHIWMPSKGFVFPIFEIEEGYLPPTEKWMLMRYFKWGIAVQGGNSIVCSSSSFFWKFLVLQYRHLLVGS